MQATVSQVIKELEEHYQVRLFEHLGKRLFLTAVSQELMRVYNNSAWSIMSTNISRPRYSYSSTYAKTTMTVNSTSQFIRQLSIKAVLPSSSNQDIVPMYPNNNTGYIHIPFPLPPQYRIAHSPRPYPAAGSSYHRTVLLQSISAATPF